jgi:hypothetical protein
MNDHQGQRLYSTITDLAFFVVIALFGLNKIIGEPIIAALLSSYAAYRFGVAQGKQQAAVAISGAMGGGGGGGGGGGVGGGGGGARPASSAAAAPLAGHSSSSRFQTSEGVPSPGPTDKVVRKVEPATSVSKVAAAVSTAVEGAKAKSDDAPPSAAALVAPITTPVVPRPGAPSLPPMPNAPTRRLARVGDEVATLSTVAPSVTAPSLSGAEVKSETKAADIESGTHEAPQEPVAITDSEAHLAVLNNSDIADSGPRRINSDVMHTLFNLATGGR